MAPPQSLARKATRKLSRFLSRPGKMEKDSDGDKKSRPNSLYTLTNIPINPEITILDGKQDSTEKHQQPIENTVKQAPRERQVLNDAIQCDSKASQTKEISKIDKPNETPAASFARELSWSSSPKVLSIRKLDHVHVHVSLEKDQANDDTRLSRECGPARFDYQSCF